MKMMSYYVIMQRGRQRRMWLGNSVRRREEEEDEVICDLRGRRVVRSDRNFFFTFPD